YAFLRNRSPHKVNPFDIGTNYLDLSLLADALEEGEQSREEALAKARESAFDSKIVSLLKILALMAGGTTRAEAGFGMRVFKECYRRAGVTEDPATHTREMPTFSGGGYGDFFTVVRDLRDESPEIADSLAEKLTLWESGPMSELFDAQSTVDFTNKFLVLQIASLDEESKPAMMAAIMESVSGTLSNPDEYADFYIDESHVMLYSEDSARYLSDWHRTSRVRATQMHYISQDTLEFTDSKYGEAILKQVGAAWVFRQSNEKAADQIADIYGLSSAEHDDIARLAKGVCHLIAGKSRYTVSVEASAHEARWFDTSPGAETRWREYQGALDAEEQAPPEAPAQPEAQTHEEDDTGELPAIVVGHEPEADSYLEKEQSYNELVPLPGESESEAAAGQIYAFSGEGAASSAGSVAKVLGARARHKGLYVLAVDATTPGGEFIEALGLEGEAAPPDQYLAFGETDLEALGSYVSPVYSDSPALMAAASPEMDALPAAPLIQASRRIFDLIVVACGASASVYSGQWLMAADRVVGCSVDSARGALEAALSAEEVRGTNGTLLATHSETSDAAELDGELEGRALFGSLMEDTDARIRLIENLLTESEGSSESSNQRSIQEEVTHE
ncbi:MAG: ATP-binding protein, partial [Rubrobacter sp.]|nr:ATP-binding protein [Rubrobacter sp.]